MLVPVLGYGGGYGDGIALYPGMVEACHFPFTLAGEEAQLDDVRHGRVVILPDGYDFLVGQYP